MYFYYKAMKESMKAFEEYKKDNPDAYYTAEWSLGYALTHHPWFILEISIGQRSFLRFNDLLDLSQNMFRLGLRSMFGKDLPRFRVTAMIEFLGS